MVVRVGGQEDLLSSYEQEAETQRNQGHDGLKDSTSDLYPLARSHFQKLPEFFERESSGWDLAYNTKVYGRHFIFKLTNYYLKIHGSFIYPFPFSYSPRCQGLK